MPESPAPRVAAWRYVIPNAITCGGILFGVLGVQAAIAGRPIAAAWWGLYCTLTDRLDGATAKALGATSALGVQLDSLADVVGFGMVPPAVLWAWFRLHPEAGWATPGLRALLSAICVVFTIASALRLARYNVKAAQGGAAHYTGTPTTMTAGIALVAFLTLLKYSAPSLHAPEWIDPWHLFGPLRLDALVPYSPLLLVVGAIGMLAPLRVPHLGRTRSRLTTALLFGSAGLGYLAGLLHTFPEYLLGGGLFYLILSIRYHFKTRS
jgi:CDP-diacylglycerol--serine O-phosphatidyltransferase